MAIPDPPDDPLPIFIDTSILRAQNFNLESGKLLALSKAVHGSALELLLPQVTEDEVLRQLEEVAEKENKKWMDLGRSTHLRFLGLGPFEDQRAALLGSLQRRWSDFLASFGSVRRLAHSHASLDEIMGWYAAGIAPFGTGRKKAEFPDAVAVSSLLAVARNTGVVRVLSGDGDFKDACEFHKESFWHYGDLGELAEEIANETEEEKVKRLHYLLGDGTFGPFATAISERFPENWFLVEDEVDGEVEDIAVESIEDVQFDVMFVDDDECTVGYSATIEWSGRVSFSDPNSAFSDREAPGGYVYMGNVAGTIRRTETVEGTFVVPAVGPEDEQYQVQELYMERSDIKVYVGYSSGEAEFEPEVE